MNVLIVGLGSIAQKHIIALGKINPDVSIIALRSSDNPSDVFGVKNIYNLDELNSLSIDFAIISNPTANHKQTIKDLIPYQIPMFIEKPIFDNLNAGQILQEIQENKILTYVACNLRFLGCIGFVKEFITGKHINEVNAYCGSYLPDWRPGKDFRKIYSANIEMGGGVHIDLIHEIDYLYWLFGAPNKMVSTKTNHSSLNISATDYANYLLQYAEFCANVILNYYRRDAKRSLEILTNEGTILVDLLENTVKFGGKYIYTSSKTIVDTYDDQMMFFIDHVLKNKEAFNTVDEAFEILKLCIAKD